MPKPVNLYIFFGLIASGKSTVAQAWAETIGATYWNSDVVRKELAGLSTNQKAADSFNEGIYTAAYTRKTYDALLERARKDLSRHKPVVLDASYQDPQERKQVLRLCEQLQAAPLFILCQCPEPLMRERMALRAKDPNAVSDGRWEIYLQQKERFQMPNELAVDQFLVLKTDITVSHLVEKLRDHQKLVGN